MTNNSDYWTRPLVQECDRSTCKRRAVVEVLNSRYALMGQFCRVHARELLRERKRVLREQEETKR